MNDSAPVDPIVCEAEDAVMCSLALDPATSFVTIVTASVSNAVAPPVLLRISDRPGKKESALFVLS